MLYWIFDLDYTLYTMNKNIEFSYSLLKNDNFLSLLLSFLPDKKIIFTNST